MSETIVCIDDLERRGKDLSIRDVLGLVSTLKEHKKCKVVLILNDDALDDGKEEFLTYFEKTVDMALQFSPTPQECADIALDCAISTNKLLAEHVVLLGISNIRVIKKIERAIREIEPMLAPFDEEVLRGVVHSMILLGWSLYEPGLAPSLDFLKGRQYLPIRSADRAPIPEHKAAWNALLDLYGFRHFDEFDAVLAEGMKRGYFDPTLVAKHGSALDAKVRADKQNAAFRKAWDLFQAVLRKSRWSAFHKMRGRADHAG